LPMRLKHRHGAVGHRRGWTIMAYLDHSFGSRYTGLRSVAILHVMSMYLCPLSNYRKLNHKLCQEQPI
jgi:hypothetical protein